MDNSNRKSFKIFILVLVLIILSAIICVSLPNDYTVALATDENLTFEIKLHHNNQIYYLSSSGFTNDNKARLKAGAELTINEVKDGFRDGIGKTPGKIFKYFYWIDENNTKQVFGWMGNTAPNDFPEKLDIYPYYSSEKYTFSFYNGQNIVNTKTYLYNANLEMLTITKNGYKFVGWRIRYISETNSQYKVGDIFNATKVPDLSPNAESDVTISLEAIWAIA